MKLEKSVAEALNEQLVFELYSGYVYLAMAARLETLKFPGAAHWVKIQADEELLHAKTFFAYLIDRKCEVTLGELAKPTVKGESMFEVFEQALEHEKNVSRRINKLATLAVRENDHATLAFLQEFLREQVQEEHHVEGIIEQLELGKDSREALLFIDRELAKRPAATNGV